VRPVLCPQGGASRRLPGARRPGLVQERRLQAGAAPRRPLQGRALPAPAQRRAACRRGEAEARLDGSLQASRQRGFARAARRHEGRHRGGDPAACRNDGLGRRGHGRCPQGAGRDRPARQHPHPVPGRQRLFLWRARARTRAPLRLRGGHQVAVPDPLSGVVQTRHGQRRSRARARHRADRARPCRREEARHRAHPGPVAEAIVALGPQAWLAHLLHVRVLQRAGDAVADRHELQGDPHDAPQVHPLDAEVARWRGVRRALRPEGRSLRDEESPGQARQWPAGRAPAQATRSTRFAFGGALMKRRTLLAASLAAPFAAPSIAWAQQWPTHPIRMIVPYAPGATGDIGGRLYGEELGNTLGQTAVVDNKTGAGGTIAMAELARSAPDGYTLGVIAQGLLVYNLGLYKTPGYDPFKDLIVLSINFSVANVLIVHPSNPAKTAADVVEQARARKGEFTFASGGVGTSHHMSGVLLEMQSGVKMTHVPYRATPAGIQAVVNGEVQMGMFNTPTVV